MMIDENREGRGRGSNPFSEERNGPIMVDIAELINRPKPEPKPTPASKTEPKPEKADG